MALLRALMTGLGLALLLGAWVASPCLAQDLSVHDERILDFSTRMVIHPDGSMTVTETIRVNALGLEIKRGIYRDLLRFYYDALGNDYHVNYEFTRVLRNGRPEPHHKELIGTILRLYMGSADTFIPHGLHTYEITYETERQIGHFDDFDEIYWNVTGNGWAFTIDKAEAVVVLPPGAEPVQTAAYTGRMNEQGQDFIQDLDPDGNPRFVTTRPLAPGEGLTVAVAWPKGFVPSPSRLDIFMQMLRDNAYFVAGYGGELLLLCFLTVAWFLVGRDPARGVIVPLFEAPDGMSPAMVRYVDLMGFDTKCLAAALVNLAVKGHVSLKEKARGEYDVIRGKSPNQPPSADEQVLLDELLGSRDSMSIRKRNHVRIRSAMRAFKASLKHGYRNPLFFRNTGWIRAGFVLALLAFLFSVSYVREPLSQTVAALLFSAWLGLGLTLTLLAIFPAWFSKSDRARSSTRRMFFLVFGLALTLSSLFFLNHVLKDQGFVLPFHFLPLVLVATLVVFHSLIKRPTRLGRRLMDGIEGLRMYLETAEQERLEQLNPPQRTPEVFEKFLPYALALDVEVSWCEQFAHVLDQAASGDADIEGAYQPAWYSGSHWRHLGAMHAAAGLGASLRSAVSASSVAPAPRSSSHNISRGGFSGGGFSGSGGGGFSGGGGGGGGGGGW